jgi:hypothetical protein
MGDRWQEKLFRDCGQIERESKSLSPSRGMALRKGIKQFILIISGAVSLIIITSFIVQNWYSWFHEEPLTIHCKIELSLKEFFDEYIENVNIWSSAHRDLYNVSISLDGDRMHTLEMDDIFHRITQRVAQYRATKAGNIASVSITADNINMVNQYMECILPINRISWSSDFMGRTQFGFEGSLTIDFYSELPRKQWRRFDSFQIKNIVESVAKADILESEIEELLEEIIRHPYVKSLETKWLWDYYDYKYDLSRYSIRHQSGRQIESWSARGITWAVHINIELNCYIMPIEKFEEQVVLIRSEIVNQLDDIRIRPYNLRFRYGLANQDDTLIIHWIFPYIVRYSERTNRGDLLFLNGPLRSVTFENLPIDNLQQAIDSQQIGVSQ